MKISKAAVILSFVGFSFANSASAMTGLEKEVPQSSIDSCVGQVAEFANYDDAVTVRHEVAADERRMSGHKMSIKTIVFGEDGQVAVREYETRCDVNGEEKVVRFDISEASQ